jgi:poly(beta-D-mannuronate) lyase
MIGPVGRLPVVNIRCVKFFGAVPILFAMLVPPLSAAPAKALQSPWDRKPVAVTDTPYSCPAIAHIVPDLTTDGFYRLDDPTHSIIDPARQAAYNASSNLVKAAGMAIVGAADDYRTAASRQAAQCAMNRIVTMAQDNRSAARCLQARPTTFKAGWSAQSLLPI